MNRMRVLSGLAGLALAVGWAGGQPPAEKPKADPKPAAKQSLEDAIAAALRNNPDVKVAEAEVQLAQAKLAQAKLAVAQKATAAHMGVDRAKADVSVTEANFKRIEQARLAATVPIAAVDEARQRLDVAKAALAKAEADYNATLGVVPNQAAVGTTWLNTIAASEHIALVDFGGVRFLGDAARADRRVGVVDIMLLAPGSPGGVADTLRGALDKPVKLTTQGEVGLGQFVQDLKQQAGLDLTFRLAPAKSEWHVPVEPGTNSLGGWLQLAEDSNPGLRFVIREYGVLATDAKTLPAGAVPVQDFWKQVRAEAAKGKAGQKK